jgi:hypothetical protein
MNSLHIYYVKNEYIEFLRNFDKKVTIIKDSEKQRPYIGIEREMLFRLLCQESHLSLAFAEPKPKPKPKPKLNLKLKLTFADVPHKLGF